MTYIDCREEREYTQEELLKLCGGEAKPYPNSWYATEQDILLRKNQCFRDEYADIDPLDEDNDYSHFSCPVERWAYMSLSI